MEVALEERISALLDFLNIEQAHFAGRLNTDWKGLATHRPEVIASLALICPPSVDPSTTSTLDLPMFVVTDSDGAYGNKIQRELEKLPNAYKCLLPDSSTVSWSDLIAVQGERIVTSYESFLERSNTLNPRLAVNDGDSVGEVEGITYRIYGEGPPLILMPLFLSPSNWQPTIQRLAENHQVILLGGQFLGAVAVLECRAKSSTYLQPLLCFLEQARLEPGDSIVEVGCGSGALTRFVHQCTEGKNSITGVDINDFLLSEAGDLAKGRGIADQLQYLPGDALSLPFEEATFDFVYSVTVIEECNAKKMISELRRVAKPEALVAIICRAIDLPFVINIELDPELKTRVQTSPSTVSPGGCADSSLYSMVVEGGLEIIDCFPSLATFHESEMPFIEFWEAGVLAALNDQEKQSWQRARNASLAKGTFFLGWPHHCVIARKS